jgi:hypothetical protein
MTSPNPTPSLRDAAGALIELAELVEQHPEIPSPGFELRGYGEGSRIKFSHYGPDAEEQIAKLVKILGVPFTKNDPTESHYNESYYVLEGTWAGVKVEIVTHRSMVCERVVVLTEDVEEEVPDPELVKALPTVKQHHTREIVEWQCNPVIAAATAAVTA